MPLVETIPNLSEGRDTRIVDLLATSIRQGGCHLLDSDPDRDHNRTVLTAAGSPATIRTGIVSLAAQAIESLDLRRHHGLHPRVGVLDVIPLVPLDRTSDSEVADLADEIGEALWRELKLPVFYYGLASPSHRRLADIRRGGLRPDLGGPALHPTAGATCLGWRRPMVAYNILLRDASLEQGQAIVTRLREANGGMAGVDALAFPTAGGTQVSMNLRDLRASPPEAVRAEVLRLGLELGVAVGMDQLVGLCPAHAASPRMTGRLLEGRLAAEALRRGGVLVRAVDDEEHHRVASALLALAAPMSALGPTPDELLYAGELMLGAERTLMAAGIEPGEVHAMLRVAAAGVRVAIPEPNQSRTAKRLAALDNWLDSETSGPV
ncbi:MAG TPA: hypothetical protein VG015_00215 [Candidatus Dormibacteraeota bacterium]|nr:hypothetical protein [Candidatus Dormibacteraeota bacterium]